MAVLTAGLRNLERQLDAAFPDRVRPDGWIGDEAHRKRTSGHNPDDTPGSKPAWDGDPDSVAEVRALDVAADLGDGVTGQQLVDHLIRLPGLARVIRYLIHRGRIWHERNGFAPEPFDGDPHSDHVHVEGAWSQAGDNDGSFDYQLEEIYVTPETIAKIADAVIARLDSAPIRLTQDGKLQTGKRSLGGSIDALCNLQYEILAAVKPPA